MNKALTSSRLGCGVAGMASLLLSHAVMATELTALRSWSTPASTRVVLEFDGRPVYRVRPLVDRVQIDVEDARRGPDVGAVAPSGLLRQLSMDHPSTALRLGLDLQGQADLHDFLLPPSGGHGYRLVLDLSRAGSAKSALAATESPAAPPAAPGPRLHGIAATLDAAALLGAQRNVVVMVDAGHGGKDPGSHGPGGTLEKNVTLAVAKDLAAAINRQPGMQAFLTRDDDTFVPLEQRFQLAREHDADLFVSIHADAYTSTDARGSSVWVLSTKGKVNAAARTLADRENNADLVGGASLDGRSRSLAAVLLDLQQGYVLQAGQAIADNVLKALRRLGPTHRGYVERANFVVLRSPDVPSLLVETAFISNPGEERKLRDPAHQQALAQAIMGGVRDYFMRTPPPGTWFAARRGESPKAKPVRVATMAPDPVPARAADAGIRELHRVEHGESLNSIARDYRTTPESLRAINHLQGGVLQAGAVLAIPES
ncbi:N-acetylmuramoyl-L-alanine amidase family protein [Frateuria aurantia]